MAQSIAYYKSPVGLLKMACDEKRLYSLLFVEATADAPVENMVTQVVCNQLDEYFSGRRQTFDFTFEQQGTPFQSKVWELLYNIPYGKTISYMQLAKRYGDVKAIRAVASANGKNNLAIVVPCHRVIGSNATLTGYAGGLWRKRWLLDHEARYYSGVQQLFG